MSAFVDNRDKFVDATNELSTDLKLSLEGACAAPLA